MTSTRERHAPRTHSARQALAAALTLVAATLVPGAVLAPAAMAAPSLGFSPVVTFDSGRTPSGVACASESACVAVDREGDALTSANPTASPPSWNRSEIDPHVSLNAVSCAPGGPCVAVDGHGVAFVNPEPSTSTWSRFSIARTSLTGVSCPSASLCVAVDAAGEVLSSESPGAGGWTPASIDPSHHLTAVSCASASLCVAVDDAGELFTSTHPTGGAGAWRLQPLHMASELTSVSCWATNGCVAFTASGFAVASADPGEASATWSLTQLDSERVTAVSCAPTGLCAAVDRRGVALASDNATSSVPTWNAANPDEGRELVGVSCLSGGFCLAVDAPGDEVAARVPPPAVTTLGPTEVTASGATLAGVVNANDAVLGACGFQLGAAAGPYTQTVPCSTLPAPLGGPQGVSAQISGLAPNAVYHYRLLASGPAGEAAGGDVAFTTAVSSQIPLVFPHPSLTGTPAVGQRLTCHAGTPVGASAQIAYAWLRDLVPIPGATASSYVVKTQDSGHHLQCQVTASDGGGSASAKSAFVTIPVEGVPASAGETFVGRASFVGGHLIVPVACSTQAGNGCRIAVRLAVVETFSRGHLVALGANAHRPAHPSVAGVRHVTVTLATTHAHLARGAHATLVATLNATGRRLLASRRRFAADVYVSGTVIGVIVAQIAHEQVTLGSSSHGASSHGASRARRGRRR